MSDIDIIIPHIQTNLSFEERLHHTRWEVTLSDETIVYSHSSRRSWLELKAFLATRSDVWITSLKFAFRDNYVNVYVGEADYFFTHACVGEYGGPTYNYFIGGYRLAEEDVVICRKYLVPEMFLVEDERRGLDDPSVRKGLILGKGNKYVV